VWHQIRCGIDLVAKGVGFTTRHEVSFAAVASPGAGCGC
jgi:hypothetical protein